MKDLMIDLETFGRSYNSVIVQFGGCYFDRYTGKLGNKICLNIDVDSSIKAGFTTEQTTIKWWFEQSDEAYSSLFKNPTPIDVSEAMVLANSFCKKARRIWSHATFDYVIFRTCLEKLNIKPLFHYRTARDIRTLTHLAKMKGEDIKNMDRVGTHHNALDDCMFQVKYCVECFNKLKS